MGSKLRSILAICIGVLPINIAMIWYRLIQTEAFTTTDILIYPLLFGGGSILLILALNKYLLGKKISDFNSGKGKWYWDIIIGIGLTLLYFMLLYVEQATASRILPPGRPPSQELINMIIDLSRRPILLAIWLGPVVWIGVAMFEEIQRVFFMNCLWNLSKNKYWELISILIVSLVIGFVHLYQGPFGILSITIQGLAMGFYFYYFRRIWPLIISHALYDSVQIILFVIQTS